MTGGVVDRANAGFEEDRGCDDAAAVRGAAAPEGVGVTPTDAELDDANLRALDSGFGEIAAAALRGLRTALSQSQEQVAQEKIERGKDMLAWQETIAERDAMRSALERARSCIAGLLAQTSDWSPNGIPWVIRHGNCVVSARTFALETVAEIDHALGGKHE